MAADPHYITGIQAGRLPNGELPLRMEFDHWWFSQDVNHINQRTLFIRALTNWQENGFTEKQPDDLSYFGIAGIHGLPLQPWPSNDPKMKDWWYCAHRLQSFGTWHTPYLILYEQQLHWEMKALIPETFEETQHAEFNQAADSWRLPYWDWAMKKPTWNPDLPEGEQYKQPFVGPNVPFIITQPKVQIRAGKGSVEPAITVRNPMFQFPLKEGTQFGDYGVSDNTKYVAKCRVTSRRPVTTDENHPNFQSDYVNGENQDYKRVTGALQGSVAGDIEGYKYFANNLPEAIKRLMTTRSSTGEPIMPYETFVTRNWSGGGFQDYPSLEAVHDNVHDFTGGAGYMGDPGTAGFDPIFWIHHCNVDRLLAIWHELYPAAYKKWLDSDPNNKNPGGPNQELKPFRDAQGNYLTSRTVSYKHHEFNFTYPDLQRWNFKNEKDYFDSIYKTFERLYSYSPKISLLLAQNAAVAEQQMAAMTPKNLQVENFPAALIDKFRTADTDSSGFGHPPALEWSNEDYLLNVLYDPFALEGEAYSIVIYLGDLPEEAQTGFGLVDFVSETTAISTVYNFNSSAEARGFDETGCASCQQQQSEGILASGQVILTDYLIERIVQGQEYQGLTLGSLDPEEVLPYLKANLHWVVQTRFGVHVANDDERMQRLRLSVAHGPAHHNSDPTTLSQYGPYTSIWNVTATGAEV